MGINSNIILCLGSNLEDRHKNIKTAVKLLKKHEIKILDNSFLYETEAVDFEDQTAFYNITLCISTNLDPLNLLNTVKRIESIMGRRESLRFGPRLIDIDILLYNDIIIESEILCIPHKKMLERYFVLQMLKDIDEEIIIPGCGLKVKDAYEKVGKDKTVVRLSQKALKGVL